VLDGEARALREFRRGREDLSGRLQEGVSFLERWRAHINAASNLEEVDLIDRFGGELEVKMAEEYAAIKTDVVAKALYAGYARARIHQMAWQVLKQDVEGARAYAIELEGAWNDTGGSEKATAYLTMTSADEALEAEARELGAIYGWQPSVAGYMPDHLGVGPQLYASDLSGVPDHAENSVHPESVCVGSVLTGAPIILSRGSRLQNVVWPLPMRLHEPGCLLVQETVLHEGEELVIYKLWQHEANPKGEDTYFGRSLEEWAQEQGIGLDVFWPKGDRNLLNARLFPGVSAQLIEAAMQGMKGAELEAEKIDELDWEIFQALPDIW
jgi:hypothetical protein